MIYIYIQAYTILYYLTRPYNITIPWLWRGPDRYIAQILIVEPFNLELCNTSLDSSKVRTPSSGGPSYAGC